LFPSPFVPEITTTAVVWFRLIGRPCTSGSSISARIRKLLRMTQKLVNLIVTAIPCHCSKEEKSIWRDRGSAIRRQTGEAWIVLHHVAAIPKVQAAVPLS
jgi:hypothetical protein